jgi:Tol biopolymer transport system component
MEVYFASAADEPSILDGIWIRTLDGSQRFRIFSGGRMPNWHPSAHSLVFVYSEAGTPSDGFTNDLFIMNRQGDILRRLTDNDAEESNPRFSPDGRWIAFTRRLRRDSLPQIWVIRSNGSGERQITTRGAVKPSWAPNSRTIVYSSANYDVNLPENGVLWTIDMWTLAESQLTQHWPKWENCNYP